MKRTWKLPAEAQRTIVRVGLVRIPVDVKLDLTFPHLEVGTIDAVVAVHRAFNRQSPSVVTVASTCAVATVFHSEAVLDNDRQEVSRPNCSLWLVHNPPNSGNNSFEDFGDAKP